MNENSVLRCDNVEKSALRTIRLHLSDLDVKRLFQKAGEAGLTVSELLENFIADLIGSSHSNGSDERDYADRWYNRCWFGAFQDYTFLYFLLQWDSVEEVLELWNDIEEGKKEIGDICKNPEDYEPDEYVALQEDIAYWQEQLDDYWNNYNEVNTGYKKGTLEEEMQKVLTWKKQLDVILVT
ncbi:MAG: molecular chaperone GrpE [Lachnospiraceae bacterium]